MHRLAVPPLAVVALCVTTALVRVSFSSESDGASDCRANSYFATRRTALVGHSFQAVRDRSRLRCAKLCLSLAECRSFNYGDDGGMCQLNDERGNDFPEDLHPNQNLSYYQSYEITAQPNGAARPECTIQNQLSTKRPTTTGATTTTSTLGTTARTYNSVTLSIIGKPTQQSSTYTSRTSDKAVDGDLDTTRNGNCVHTDANREDNPWWRVDLEEEHCISKVTILNRGYCCSERTEHAVARAGLNIDILNNTACGSPVTAEQAAPPGGLINITCNPPLRARYVSVNLPVVQTILNFCEVMVEEVPLEQCPT